MAILEFLSEAFLEVLNMSITASWVILAAILLRFLIPASDPIDIDTIYSAEMVVNAGGLNTGKSAAPTLPAPISPMQLAQMILPILWAVGMMVLLIAAPISLYPGNFLS